MPFKSGDLAGKLTRRELLEQYGSNFEKIGKFWTRKEIIEKLQAKGVEVEGEELIVVAPVVEEQPVEVVEEVPVEEVVEEEKPAPKKRGRPKKQK